MLRLTSTRRSSTTRPCWTSSIKPIPQFNKSVLHLVLDSAQFIEHLFELGMGDAAEGFLVHSQGFGLVLQVTHPYRRSHCQVARIPAPAVELPGLTALLATEAD